MALMLSLALDAYLDSSTAVPVCKIGASDFYFAVSTSHSELLTELNAAMSRIQEEDEYYNQRLNAKYIKPSGVNLYLGAEEKEWLSGHGPIRVGYQDNYLAFCASDPKTGELTGALKEYLSIASDCIENAHIDFEAIAYDPVPAGAQRPLEKEGQRKQEAGFRDGDRRDDGLYRRYFFNEYIDRMYREHPEKQMDAIVLNIEQFHTVNATNGRLFGDQVICALVQGFYFSRPLPASQFDAMIFEATGE